MSLDCYSPIHFDNLEIIQSKIADIILNTVDISKPLFEYHKAKKFTDIPEFKEQLQDKNLYDFLHYAVINVSLKGTSPIHTDSDAFIYSLNIPIIGYKNTYLHFYESDEKPIVQGTGSGGVTYRLHNYSQCRLIQKIETTEPAIVNTQVAHCFQNCNIEPRVVLLLRLSPSWKKIGAP